MAAVEISFHVARENADAEFEKMFEVDDDTTIPDESSTESSVDEALSRAGVDLASGGTHENMQWALNTTAEGMKSDPQHRQATQDAMNDFMENPGLVGTFKTAVKTQETVLASLARHEERQCETLDRMVNLLHKPQYTNHIPQERKSEAEAQAEMCKGDALRIRDKLVAYVQEVLENTAGIDYVVMNMEEGMKQFKMLQKEAQGDRRNRWMRRYANRAYEHLKHAELSEENKQKMKLVEANGLALAKEARESAERLADFSKLCKEAADAGMTAKYAKDVADMEARKKAEEQAMKEAKEEAEREALRKERIAKSAAKWSFWGTCGLVALSVVGVGIATAAIVASGGAAAAPIAYMSAHAVAWTAGTVAGGAAVGAVAAGTSTVQKYRHAWKLGTDIASLQQTYDDDLKQLNATHAAEREQLGNEQLQEEIETVVDFVTGMVEGYRDLCANVKKVGQQSVVLMSHLQFMANGAVSPRNAVKLEEAGAGDMAEAPAREPDDEELEMMIEDILMIDEKRLLELEQSIKNVRDSNIKLKELALEAFERYCGLDEGSTAKADEAEAKASAEAEAEVKDDTDLVY